MFDFLRHIFRVILSRVWERHKDSFRNKRSTHVPTSPYTTIDTSKGDVRLLTLAPGKFDDPIHARLETACLEDEPVYQAISYALGKDRHDVPAIVNGLPLVITVNLDCALRHFRSDSCELVLWVDAICINQEDDLEKSAQVQLVKQIYSKADQVLVWLGPATDATDELFDYLDTHTVQSTIQLTDVDRLLPALRDFTSRDWFSRVWVCQEFASAKTCPGPAMCCGPRRFYWDSWACNLGKLLGHTRYRDLNAEESRGFFRPAPSGCPGKLQNERYQQQVKQRLEAFMALTNFWGDVWKCVHILQPFDDIRKLSVASRHRSFPYQILLTRTMHATDPRDKVFGLIGISAFAKRPLVPDYTKSARLVYCEAMAIAFQAEKFYYACMLWSEAVEHKSRDLPSWVVDLSRTDVSTEKFYFRPECPPNPSPMSKWSTCVPLVKFSNLFQTMHAEGVILGVVETCCEVPLEIHCQHPEDLYGQYYVEFKIRAREGVKAHIEQPSFAFGEPRQDRWPRTAVITDGIDECAQAGDPRMHFSFPTGMFATDTGKLGLTSPGKVQQGDIIAGLFGVNMPFVLRRRGEHDRYEMIDAARIGDHVLGHPEIPEDCEEADLYTKYGFRTFDID